MAVIKAVSSHAPIGTAIDYVEKREKTEERLLYGIGVTPETAKEEMQATKEIYGKTDGRTYKHFVQSFAPGENITPEKAHEIAKEFAESFELFKGYEVLIATHKDKKHVHTHFIINSVSFEDGKKFQMSSKDLQKMKDRSDEICHEHGLSICEKNKTFDGHERTGITAWTKEKYHFMKDMLEGKSVKSYVYNTMEVVKDSMNRAVSREEFVKLLSEKGYSVDWQDKHKHLTFMNQDGNKVRDTNLNKTFNLGIGMLLSEELMKL
ncbi:relaxase/mobilization nuclease domain-containing protein [Butyrivibrio sp. INlla14]|uniref:relaxase/mobilization nuclease domain-containing protein n=1 Tax=Butyrivibrio sp. INlla14 TaxID=1520808 RepID=UPI0008770EF1|nr:relaxase/mobilization nuclease domain-containing protein [Butyrivibrio sp. INlla14]SCY75677.1 Relaxase/Mobilisation nuclease domain-containing protein [Butyrivibrio sp. INlla14]